jgi:hypothetical protein
VHDPPWACLQGGRYSAAYIKSRQKEMGEVERARLAQKICEAEHEEVHVDVFEPEVM